MTPEQINLISDSWDKVEPISEQAADIFYSTLFEADPSLNDLFKGDMQEQGKKLMAMIGSAVKLLNNLDKLVPVLEQLGIRHESYGVKESHYDTVGGALLETLAAGLGDDFTDEVKDAWTEVYGLIASTMINAVKTNPELTSSSNSQSSTEENTMSNSNAAFFMGAIEQSGTASVMIDRDFNITYANKATLDLLKKHEATFQIKYPGFKSDASSIIGACIDGFHANPTHQRKLLENPDNLPIITDINIEDLIFELNVTAINDSDGNYIGNALEWQDVTAMRANANISSQLQGAIDQSGTANVMIDRDFIITYANQATLDIFIKHEATFQIKYPGFKADPNIIIGTCIDVFHKDPAHQRKMLGDENNLPYKTDIHVEHLTFSLNVTAIKDAAGNYMGNSLEWQDVTNLRSQENQAAQLQGAIDQSGTANVTIDRDLVITYANQATFTIFKQHEATFQNKYPGFSAEPEAILGTCIDVFHANPAHQRKLLDDPKNLPWKTDIRIEHLIFELNVTAINDANGSYVGNSLEWRDVTDDKNALAAMNGQLEAISKAQAVIEFNMDGTIITANDNFLNTLGYTIDEIKGQHHSMFADPSYKNSIEYSQFWDKLNRGEYDAGEYKRIGKGGKEVWIQASYNPIIDVNGKPMKVIKYATDITESMLKNADFAGQIDAIGKSQAVIEFNMDGTIIIANDNFLGAVGYSMPEIKGQHHSIFVDREYKATIEYSQFWEKLNRGEYDSSEYKRIAKGGREIWIQASYNPIMDLNGKPFKVVKYATDVTGRKEAVAKIKAVLLTMADGDLTTTIEGQLEGEFNELGEAMNSLIDNLSNLVSEIRVASTNVFSASKEQAQGNLDLSQRTETQASSLEETASAMEELTTTVQQNSENASTASKLSSSAMDKASSGGAVVQNAVVAMEEINKSSKQIADIIGVIDEIAFQTNLLALNAAVEAARAGEKVAVLR